MCYYSAHVVVVGDRIRSQPQLAPGHSAARARLSRDPESGLPRRATHRLPQSPLSRGTGSQSPATAPGYRGAVGEDCPGDPTPPVSRSFSLTARHRATCRFGITLPAPESRPSQPRTKEPSSQALWVESTETGRVRPCSSLTCRSCRAGSLHQSLMAPRSLSGLPDPNRVSR